MSASSALRAGTRRPRGPRSGPQDPGLPGCRGCADRRGQHGRGGVPADRYPAPAARIIGQCPARQASYPGCCIGDALDQPQRGRGSVQGDGEQARQQGSRNLMAQVRQETGRADPGHAPAEPPRAGGIIGLGISCHNRRLYGLPMSPPDHEQLSAHFDAPGPGGASQDQSPAAGGGERRPRRKPPAHRPGRAWPAPLRRAAASVASGITCGPVRRRSRWLRPGRVPGGAGARRRLRRIRR